MSQYHPLDVRHPDNRDLLRRNFLLDPPAATPAAPERSAASRPGVRKVAAAPAAASPAPWGAARNSPAATAVLESSSPSRTAGKVARFAMVVVFIAIALQSQTHLLDGFVRWLHQTAADLGVTLPF